MVRCPIKFFVPCGLGTFRQGGGGASPLDPLPPSPGPPPIGGADLYPMPHVLCPARGACALRPGAEEVACASLARPLFSNGGERVQMRPRSSHQIPHRKTTPAEKIRPRPDWGLPRACGMVLVHTRAESGLGLQGPVAPRWRGWDGGRCGSMPRAGGVGTCLSGGGRGAGGGLGWV